MAKKLTDYQIQEQIKLRWGATHEINKVYGTNVTLTDLPKDVSVCYGDGKTYHFQLKKLTHGTD